ncbi:MAG: hypothetical protein ACM3ZV_07120 [Bacillota bacterium]
MATTARRATPAHLWIVGILALAWNGFGCFDYLMTVTENQTYLGNIPADQIAYMNALPTWLTGAWAIGVWGGLLGSLLLLMRSRHAVLAFALSFVAAVIAMGYEMFMTEQPASMKAGAMAVMPWVVLAVCALLLWYSWNAEKKGLLR